MGKCSACGCPSVSILLNKTPDICTLNQWGSVFANIIIEIININEDDAKHGVSETQIGCLCSGTVGSSTQLETMSFMGQVNKGQV